MLKPLSALPALLSCTALVIVSAQAIRHHRVPDDALRARLNQVENRNDARMRTLVRLFEEAGCRDERLQLQKLSGTKLQNVICTLAGESAVTVVVGAHYDHTEQAGMGAADNWSGASMLPSLYEGASKTKPKITFVFVGFAEEETGLHGARRFAAEWEKPGSRKPQAMVNLDTLGLSPTKIWLSRSDEKLAQALAQVARAVKLPVSGMNIEQVGETDSRIFHDNKIPVLDLHSVTQERLSILHSNLDQLDKVRFDDYRDSYLLVAGFLAYLDALQAQAMSGTGGSR